MKTAEERAQIMLDALKLYNPELKPENDSINKDAIIKMIKDTDKITRHTCAEKVNSLDQDYIEDVEHAIESVHSAIMNTKAV